MRIIAVANQKGGCGKTTIVINLAACLAREGQRVLALDLDPQGHCALGLAVPEEQIELSIANVLEKTHDGGEPDLSRATWQISSNFDLVPSRTDLARMEQKFAGVENRREYLRRILDTVCDRYDVVLIDTPPNIGFLTESAIHAATDIIVPVDTGYFSLQGLSKQLDTIRELRADEERPVTVRVLANLYDVRTKLGREILAELRKRHADAMLTSFINFNTKLKESTSLGQPVTEYDPSSMGCRDFVNLAREIIRVPDAPPAPSPSLLEQADALAESAGRLLATSETLLGSGRLERADAAPSLDASDVATPAETSTAAATPEREDSMLAPTPLSNKQATPLPAVRTAVPVLQSAPPTPQQTDRRIAAIYGVHQEDAGVEFVIAAPGASTVRLAGDFNNWNPERTPLKPMRDGSFQVLVPLAPGRYRYRYVVDGLWRNDPANGNVEINPFGELNSIVEVG